MLIYMYKDGEVNMLNVLAAGRKIEAVWLWVLHYNSAWWNKTVHH